MIDVETYAAAKAYTDSHGEGGTTNYNILDNKPQINAVELSGNKTAEDLGLVASVEGKGLSTNDYTDEAKAIVDSVTGALAEKADTDDIPDLVSDNLAKGILGNETVLSTDNVPFVSKLMSEGKYQRKKFVGCSYVWNQLVQNGNFSNGTTGWGSANSTISVTDNVLTLTATANKAFMEVVAYHDAINFTQGHKIFCSCWIKSSKATVVKAQIGRVTVYRATPTADTWVKSAVILEDLGGVQIIYIGFDGLAEVGDTLDVKEVFLTDLTQLFGSTAIADAIYNLEQATAGAGIAKLKELGFFTEDYYAYDAGSVQSVDIKEYSVTGKNWFGGDAMLANAIELKGAGNRPDIDTSLKRIGVNATYDSNRIILSFNKVLPNTQYTILLSAQKFSDVTSNLKLLYTDGTYTMFPNLSATGEVETIKLLSASNKTISGIAGVSNSGNEYIFTDGSGLFLGDVSIDEFEPYHVSTYPLTPTELRGVPKIDASNNIYCDGDEYASDGGHNVKYDIVDLGTLTYTYGGGFFTSSIVNTLPTPIAGGYDGVCSNYKVVRNAYSSSEDKILYYSDLVFSNSKRIYVKDSNYTDPADFKAAMSGQYLVYEKATPTTETLTHFDYPQSVGSLEEIVDYKVEQEQRDVAIPTGHVTEYMGKGGEFTLPTLPETPSVLAYDGHNFFWKPETA